MNNTIWFPKEHFVVIRPQNSHPDYPLAFMTQEEHDHASEKRKKTARRWGKRGRYRKGQKSGLEHEYSEETVNNEAKNEFVVMGTVRRTWNTNNVHFKIADPRGWTLHISSENMYEILNTGDVESGGVIPGKCKWARKGSENWLVHEKSPEWDRAEKQTRGRNNDLSISDVELGDKVLIQKSIEGIYLGYWIALGWERRVGETKQMGEYTKAHVFQRDDGSVVFHGTPDVRSISEGIEISENRVSEILNELDETNVYNAHLNRMRGYMGACRFMRDVSNIKGHLESTDTSEDNGMYVVDASETGPVWTKVYSSMNWTPWGRLNIIDMDIFLETGKVSLKKTKCYYTESQEEYDSLGLRKSKSVNTGIYSTTYVEAKPPVKIEQIRKAYIKYTVNDKEYTKEI